MTSAVRSHGLGNPDTGSLLEALDSPARLGEHAELVVRVAAGSQFCTNVIVPMEE